MGNGVSIQFFLMLYIYISMDLWLTSKSTMLSHMGEL
jgi:hypothetical protein